MLNVHSFFFSIIPFLYLSFSLFEDFYDILINSESFDTITNFTNGDTSFCLMNSKAGSLFC